MVKSKSALLRNRMNKKMHDLRIERFYNEKREHTEDFKNKMRLLKQYNREKK